MTRPVGSQQKLEARRRQAVALLELGHSAGEVADLVDVTPGSVNRWRRIYEQEGWDGLTAKPHKGGPSPKLPKEHWPELAALLEEGPQANGFDTDRWTLHRISRVIEREFGVSVSYVSIWRYLQRMGWSCQKPQRRARQRDAWAVRRWQNITAPTVEKKHD